MKKFNGEIKDFPQEIVEKMLERQVEQGNKRDVTVFEECKFATNCVGGFNWDETPEGVNFWNDVIDGKMFHKFFEKYPQKNTKIGPINLETAINMVFSEISDEPIKKDFESLVEKILESKKKTKPNYSLGIIGDSSSHEVQNLVDEANKFFRTTLMINPKNLSYSFVPGTNKITVKHGDDDISDLSAIFVRGTMYYPLEVSVLTKALEYNGCFIVDGIDRFSGCKPSKVKTTISRFIRGVGSTSHFALNKSMAVKLVETLSLPLVVKPVSGSQGNGVQLLETKEQVDTYINNFSFDKPILFQEKIDVDKEYRLLVVGGKVIGMFNKTAAEGEIAANHSRGGTWKQEKNSDLAAWVESVVSKDGLLGVDAAIDVNGQYHIIEENRRPTYGNTINVGRYIVKHIIENINKPKSQQFNGEIKDFPQEIVEKMLEKQVEQRNPRDVTIFEKNRCISKSGGGFSWGHTSEGHRFWVDVIGEKNFKLFFEKYPKNKCCGGCK